MTLTELFISAAKMDTLPLLAGACDTLRKAGYTIETDDQHFAICNPPVASPVALIAHCDAVWDKPPAKIVDRNGVLSVKRGGILGADDRAGVAAILACVLRGSTPQIYLTTGEESGGIGATALANSGYTPPDSVRVLLQLDRQSGNDFVTYDCASADLDAWCERFGWIKDSGLFSDISILAPWWGIAAANLSVGYYNQHSRQEYLVIPQLEHCVRRVRAMIDAPPKERITYVERPVRKWRDEWSTYRSDYRTRRDTTTGAELDSYGFLADKTTSDELDDSGQWLECVMCGDYFPEVQIDFVSGRCDFCEADRKGVRYHA